MADHSAAPSSNRPASQQASRARERLFAGLEKIYQDLEAELQQFGPRCQQSGFCCDFEAAGHTLFASSVEMAYLKAREKVGQKPVTANRCPLLVDGRCSVHRHRGLGCRVYFCDPAFAGPMPDIHERFYKRIQNLWQEAGAEAGIDWAYRPWLDWLSEPEPEE